MIDAAVLVPIVLRSEGSTVLLTRRAEHLHNHPGQISFPGGRKEQSDPDAVATALRELQEELSIGAENVQVISYLDQHLTVSGFRITPVVGVLRTLLGLQPDSNEVAEVFEIPLDFALDEANYKLTRIKHDEHVRSYFVLSFETRKIWGATAGILYTLLKKANTNSAFKRIVKGLS